MLFPNRSKNFAQARAQSDRDYEETAAAVAEKQALTAAEEAELNGFWRKLVKLYHPDRFAHEPDKLATYEKLTAAINRAKEAGDIQTLREIAEDPAGLRHLDALEEARDNGHWDELWAN